MGCLEFLVPRGQESLVFMNPPEGLDSSRSPRLGFADEEDPASVPG